MKYLTTISILFFFLLSNTGFAQWDMYKFENVETLTAPMYYEDPQLNIHEVEDILVPDLEGIWTCFEVLPSGVRNDLFTREVDCIPYGVEGRENKTSSTIKTFPNPVDDNLLLQLPSENISIKIFDMKGMLLISDFSNNKNLINISTIDLISGSYIIQCNSQNFSHTDIFVVK